jgi:hypothetical protein
MQKLFIFEFLNGIFAMQIYVVIIHFFQSFTVLQSLGFLCGYPSLVTSLIAVACSQFDKLKAAILDIQQEYITSHQRQEFEGVPTIANCNLQDKLNACIRHHQQIMA